MYKIIIQANEIPLGSIITKIRGEKEYVIRNEIIIYNKDGAKTNIKAQGSSRFLINDTGDINVVGPDLELVWLAGEYELVQYLNIE